MPGQRERFTAWVKIVWVWDVLLVAMYGVDGCADSCVSEDTQSIDGVAATQDGAQGHAGARRMLTLMQAWKHLQELGRGLPCQFLRRW